MIGVNRATLREQAYVELRSRIVAGELASGTRLLPEQLASELAVSPTPVKEALALLQRDGLVVGFSRGPSVVRRFTAEDVVQIYEARSFLELHALAVAVGRADEHFLARLEGFHIGQMRAAARQTRAGLAEAIRFDRQFHEEIVSLAGNPILSEWHRTILRQTQTVRTHTLESYDPERSRQDHGSIVDAIRRRDLQSAHAILVAHLDGSRDGLVERLSTLFADPK